MALPELLPLAIALVAVPDGAASEVVVDAYQRALATREPVVVEIYAPSLGRWFELRIHPLGRGLSVYTRDKLAHVFDRFWQAPEHRREGVGLGLAIVKGIVDAHRGVICVDSEVGRGTTFALTLPAKSARQPGGGPDQG